MLRTATWNNLGVEASENSLDTLLAEADLDYNAVARDLYVDGGDGTQILVPNKKMIVREDTNQLFGIVSDRYQICQNRDALDFIQYIDGIELQKAGQSGSYVYLIARMPEVTVLGDTIRPHLIFQNSHDGSCSIKTTMCMLRIVCQNQFVRAFNDSPATVSISHLGNIEEKMLVANQTFQQLHQYVQNFDAEANALATKRLTPSAFNKILDKFFAMKEENSARRNELIMLNRDQFVQSYKSEDNQNFIGTQWGAVNAYADYLTHYETLRKTENFEVNRFYSSLNSKYMDEFIEFVTEIAA